MPFRGTGFIQPLPMALLTAATVATMLWIVFTDDKKNEKKTKDASRPRSPRTMMFPKVSFRDFANDSKVYCEEEDFEVIVLEKWVDKYDGPSSAYSRTRFPTESHDRPMVAESYSPAARQHRPRQPVRRPPVKFDPVAVRRTSSIFGDAGFFASTQAMGDFYREKPATIVHRADSAEFMKRTKDEAGDNSRHSEEDEYVDAPGLPLLLFHDARGVPMSLGRDTYDGEDNEFYDSEGLSLEKLEEILEWLDEDDDHPFFDALDVPHSSFQGQQLGPVQELQRPHVLLMAVLISMLNEYSVSACSFVNLLLFSLGQSLGGARKTVVSALEYCRFQYSFAISLGSILMSSLLESIGGAMRSVVSPHRYRSLQLVARKITQMLKRPFLSRRSVLLMAILISMLNEYSVSACSFVNLLLFSLGQSLGGARKTVVSALEYCRFQYSFAISLGSILMSSLLESIGGALRSVVSPHRYRSLQLVARRITHLLKRPFLSRRSVLLMAILIFVLNDYSVSACSFANLLLFSLGQSLGGARKTVVSALEYCRFQYSFAISLGSILMSSLLESIGGALRSVVSPHRYRSLQLVARRITHLLKRPFLSRRSVLLMAILIFVLNDYSVSVSSFVSLLLLISLGQSLGGARKTVLSALEYCRFQYSFAISRGSISMYRLLESLEGALRSVVSSHRYRSLQLVARRITHLLKRPFRR
ncbi:Hypp1130 [Branchiostoma lanceolatum]|uniref:Hypp1130 protein n=1 Tax=Branchiostoma lanceolatum TaxID=7740 RepID=A0A8K0EM51_BRALA|nr:Hypp1130 [Branchiostoma lanceolatum]